MTVPPAGGASPLAVFLARGFLLGWRMTLAVAAAAHKRCTPRMQAGTRTSYRHESTKRKGPA